MAIDRAAVGPAQRALTNPAARASRLVDELVTDAMPTVLTGQFDSAGRCTKATEGNLNMVSAMDVRDQAEAGAGCASFADSSGVSSVSEKVPGHLVASE